MEGLKDGLKVDMEVLTKLLQQMLPNDEKIIDETHDEKKRNVNQHFIESNTGLNTHHIAYIDMRNFDGNDRVTWILKMEQYVDLHNVKHTQKACIETLYLKPNLFVWYRWLHSCKPLLA